MAPRENDTIEILQRILENQNDLSFSKRKSRIDLALAIGVPSFAILAAGAAFYFNSQSDIRQLQREVNDLKTTVATMAVQDRTRLQNEIDKLTRETESLKRER